MGKLNLKFLKFMAILSCYLVLSIPFISASSMSAYFSGGISPKLTMINFPSISCGDSGYKKFSFTIENVLTEFSVDSLKLEVIVKGNAYDVSNALSCSPLNDLLSNERVDCSINVDELFSKLPKCKDIPVLNTARLSVKLSTGEVLSGESDFYVTKEAKPSMKIMDVFPSTFNCVTGTIFNVNLNIEHAELMRSPSFSYTLNDSDKFEFISCTLSGSVPSQDKEKITDYYSCKLRVYNTSISSCPVGSTLPLTIFAEEGGLKINASKGVSLISETPSFSISASMPTQVECEVINENFECIPKQASKTLTLTINKNIEGEVKVVNFRYNINGGEFEDTLCKEGDENTYECPVIIPPSLKEGEENTLGVQADLSYMNYFTNVSTSLSFVGSGDRSMANEIIDMEKKLQKQKEDNEKSLKIWTTILDVINMFKTLACCCALGTFLGNLFSMSGEEIVQELMKQVFGETLFSGAWGVVERIFEVVLMLGDNAAKCIIEAQNKLLESAMKKLNEFDNLNSDSTQLETFDYKIPCTEWSSLKGIINCAGIAGCVFKNMLLEMVNSATCGISDCFSDGYWKCFASVIPGLGNLACIAVCPAGGLGDRIEKCVRCGTCSAILLGMIVAHFVPGGQVVEEIGQYCNMAKTYLSFISMGLNIIISLISFGNTNDEIQAVQDVMRKRVEFAGAKAIAMKDYSESLLDVTQNLAEMSMQMQYASFLPRYPTPLFYINDTFGNLVEYGQEVCKNDEIILTYNLEKLNSTGSYVPEVEIESDKRGSVKTLTFTELSGVYGPVDIGTLFDIPEQPTPPNPVERDNYYIKINYPGGSMNYVLEFNNETDSCLGMGGGA